jgi:hypothetical protein
MSNRFLTICAHFLVALLMAGCASAVRDEIGVQRFAQDVPAQSDLALIAAQRGAWIAWAGALSAPDLFVQPIGAAQAWQFPISGAPSQVRLLPLAERRAALLWLERLTGSTSRLQCATLEPSGALRRAPFDIGAAQRYSAVPTPDGGILAFIINDGQLSIARLDRLGRPFGAYRLAEAAHLAAATLDARDRVHVLWLAPSDGALWQLLYVTFEVALLDQPAPRLPAPTLLAVLRLAAGQYIESLSAGTDELGLYAVWNVIGVRQAGESARLEGVYFPLSAPTVSRALDLSALPADLRGVSIPFANLPQGGAPTLVGSLPRHVVYGALTAQGVFRVRQLMAAGADEQLVSAAAAALSANNALHLAWLTQNAQGATQLRYAVFPRPQPAVAVN